MNSPTLDPSLLLNPHNNFSDFPSLQYKSGHAPNPSIENPNRNQNPNPTNFPKIDGVRELAQIQNPTNSIPILDSPRAKGKTFAELLSSEQRTSSVPLREWKLHKGIPTVYYEDHEIQHLLDRYKLALVGKFSHGKPKLADIRQAFDKMHLRGQIEIGLLRPGYIFIDLHDHEDWTRLWTKHSWMIAGAPMRIFKWTKSFKFDEESPLAPVWLQLIGLQPHMFDPPMLCSLAACIGKPIRVDKSTVVQNRRNCARVCVELDVRNHIPATLNLKIGVDDCFISIVPEYVPEYCSFCKHINHSAKNCFVNPDCVVYKGTQENAPTKTADKTLIPLPAQAFKTDPMKLGKNSDKKGSDVWIPVVKKKQTLEHKASVNSVRTGTNNRYTMLENDVDEQGAAVANAAGDTDLIDDGIEAGIVSVMIEKEIRASKGKSKIQESLPPDATHPNISYRTTEHGNLLKASTSKLNEAENEKREDEHADILLKTINGSPSLISQAGESMTPTENINSTSQARSIINDIITDNEWITRFNGRKKSVKSRAKIDDNLAMGVKCSIDPFNTFLSSLEGMENLPKAGNASENVQMALKMLMSTLPKLMHSKNNRHLSVVIRMVMQRKRGWSKTTSNVTLHISLFAAKGRRNVPLDNHILGALFVWNISKL